MDWVLTGIIFFVSSCLHGITGFGFVILALPLLILFSDPHDAVVICTILAAVNAVILIFRTWRDILFPMVKTIFLSSLLGLPVGLFVFLNFDLTRLKALIASLTVICGCLLLPQWSFKFDGFVKSPSVPLKAGLRFTFVAAAYHPSTPHSSGFARLASGAFYAAIGLATFYEIIKFKNEKIAESVVGFLSGFFQGSVGMVGIPPALYITIQGIQKAYFRANLNAIILILGTIGIILFRYFSPVPASVYIHGLLFIPVIFAGQVVGIRYGSRVSQQLFRKLVLFTIIGSGLYSLIRLGMK